jgi:hypothetical protein
MTGSLATGVDFKAVERPLSGNQVCRHERPELADNDHSLPLRSASQSRPHRPVETLADPLGSLASTRPKATGSTRALKSEHHPTDSTLAQPPDSKGAQRRTRIESPITGAKDRHQLPSSQLRTTAFRAQRRARRNETASGPIDACVLPYRECRSPMRQCQIKRGAL